MLQAAYVTKNSFAASDSATKAGRLLPARESLGITQKDFCTPCLERHGSLVRVSAAGLAVGMCAECFSGVSSKPHRQHCAARFTEMEKQRIREKRNSERLRLEGMIEFVKDFMPNADTSLCAICGQDKIINGIFCATCRNARAALASAKSWLRNYKKHGDRKMLVNAVSLIRTHGITPEDFKFI